MKPVVFMCLTTVGAVVGLYIAERTYEPSRNRNNYPDPQINERVKFMTLCTLGGVVAGAGLGWVAVNIEKFSDWE